MNFRSLQLFLRFLRERRMSNFKETCKRKSGKYLCFAQFPTSCNSFRCLSNLKNSNDAVTIRNTIAIHFRHVFNRRFSPDRFLKAQFVSPPYEKCCMVIFYLSHTITRLNTRHKEICNLSHVFFASHSYFFRCIFKSKSLAARGAQLQADSLTI